MNLARKKLTRFGNFALNFWMELPPLQQIDLKMDDINASLRHCEFCKVKETQKNISFLTQQ